MNINLNANQGFRANTGCGNLFANINSEGHEHCLAISIAEYKDRLIEILKRDREIKTFIFKNKEWRDEFFDPEYGMCSKFWIDAEIIWRNYE